MWVEKNVCKCGKLDHRTLHFFARHPSDFMMVPFSPFEYGSISLCHCQIFCLKPIFLQYFRFSGNICNIKSTFNQFCKSIFRLVNISVEVLLSNVINISFLQRLNSLQKIKWNYQERRKKFQKCWLTNFTNKSRKKKEHRILYYLIAKSLIVFLVL